MILIIPHPDMAEVRQNIHADEKVVLPRNAKTQKKWSFQDRLNRVRGILL
jgi:hypothetical protein